MIIKTLDIVALVHSIKEKNLEEGERGTVVEVYGNGEAYEVEFVNESGKTKAILTLNPFEIISSVNKAPIINWTTPILGYNKTDLTSNPVESKTEVFDHYFA